MGNAWTSDYLKITGELDVDLRSNIAAEARAKIVYERLIDFCDDAGTKEALQFLMTREITHMQAFMLALDGLKKPALSIGRIAPTPGIVEQYYNTSTGDGDLSEQDTEGPWLKELQIVDSPALTEFQVLKATPRSSKTTLSPSTENASRSKKRNSKGIVQDEDNTLGVPPE
jgi:Mn-containing catalase